MNKQNVLLVDDHQLILRGLQDFLNSIDYFSKVDISPNYSDLTSKLASETYKIIFLDIHFGDKDGREIAKEIRKKYPTIILAALTSFDDVETIQASIHAGFNAFFLKSDDLNEIKKWLELDTFDKVYISENAKNIYTQYRLIKDFKEINSITLTQREKEVLTLIMEEFTTKQIAEKMFLSQKTIESYRSNLMSKLGVTNTAGLVKKTILLGLLGQ